MRKLIFIILILGLIAALTPAVSAATSYYGNYSAFGNETTYVLIGQNATSPNVGKGYYSGAYHAEDISEQICVPMTGKHFWKLSFQPTSAHRGYSEAAAYDDQFESRPAAADWNYTNADPKWDYNLTAVLICSTDGMNVDKVAIKGYTIVSSLPGPSPVNFTGYPLDGFAPLTVGFTATNLTNTTGVQWTFGDGNITTVDGSTISHTYNNAGIYAVTMSYFNGTVQESITKNNYVLASIPSGMIVNLDVKNAITGALIQDSTVSIRNVSSGVWRNTTAPTGLVYFSSTDPGYLYPLSQNQTITLAANKSGYRDASDTFAIPYDNYRARLFLMPTSVTNATGAGTVVVNVVRNKDGLTVSGMSVVADTGQIGVTNSAGAVTLYNVTAGDRVIKVSDPDGAYQDTEKSITLTAGETKLVVIQVVLEGESPVDVPVTPTPTGTFDPSDPSSYGEYGNYTSSEMNQAGGFVILQMLGQLFNLWPLVVMGIFFKFMKSAFS